MCVGPIESEIWGKVIDGSRPEAAAQQRKGGSLFDAFVDKAVAVSRQETTKPGFFFPASRIGEKVYSVRFPAPLCPAELYHKRREPSAGRAACDRLLGA
jgi:hypothetical protein